MNISDLSDLLQALAVLPFLLGSYVLGLALQRRLPEKHRGPKTHEMIKLVMEMLVTFAAIVLGLLITSSKGRFDAAESDVRAFAIDVVTLDQTLHTYGSAATTVHDTLADYIEEVRSQTASPAGTPILTRHFGLLAAAERGVIDLSPATPLQFHLQQTALDQIGMIRRQRERIDEEVQGHAGFAFYAMLTAWLMVIYGCFGLISEHTWLGGTVLGLSMLAVALALFVIFELDTPFTGLIVVSDQPLVDVARAIAAE